MLLMSTQGSGQDESEVAGGGARANLMGSCFHSEMAGVGSEVSEQKQLTLRAWLLVSSIDPTHWTFLDLFHHLPNEGSHSFTTDYTHRESSHGAGEEKGMDASSHHQGL